jgi:hypothetical protein
MNTVLRLLNNYLCYAKSLLSRRKRRKAREEEDPFIYPHF